MSIILRTFKISILKNATAKKFILIGIGEIFLVMFGILLALEVDNWKEKQRNIRKGKPSILPPEHYQKQAEKFRGIPRSQEVKDKISKAKKGKFVPQPNQMKTYEVIKPNGEVLIVKGLNEFCNNEGIDASNMCNVAKGKFKQHKGYKCRLINT